MQGLVKDKADHVSLDFLDSYKRQSIYGVCGVSKKERRENKESGTH